MYWFCNCSNRPVPPYDWFVVCTTLPYTKGQLYCVIFLQELDPVTLHNQALMNMEDNPTQGFEKLQFLLQQNPCPPGMYNLTVAFNKTDCLYKSRHNMFCIGSRPIVRIFEGGVLVGNHRSGGLVGAAPRCWQRFNIGWLKE